jgi:hypothetical protein
MHEHVLGSRPTVGSHQTLPVALGGREAATTAERLAQLAVAAFVALPGVIQGQLGVAAAEAMSASCDCVRGTATYFGRVLVILAISVRIKPAWIRLSTSISRQSSSWIWKTREPSQRDHWLPR